MKKILLLFAFFVGLSSCETAEEEPTMQQLVGEFEMTAELGEHLVNSLSDHMLIAKKMYDEGTWAETYLLGGGPTSYFLRGDGNGILFSSCGDGFWLSNQYRANVAWSYDNATNSVIINGESHPIVYYKHPVLIWEGWPGYCEFVLEDSALLEEYMQKYHYSLPRQTVTNEWLCGRVYAFTAQFRESIPSDDGGYNLKIHATEQQYIYFAEDGTGVAFVKAPVNGDKRFTKYQMPVRWTVEYDLVHAGGKGPVIRLNDTRYEIIHVFEKYISDQKQIPGFELYEVKDNCNNRIVGDCDDYDLDRLKAEYCDPQP